METPKKSATVRVSEAIDKMVEIGHQRPIAKKAVKQLWEKYRNMDALEADNYQIVVTCLHDMKRDAGEALSYRSEPRLPRANLEMERDAKSTVKRAKKGKPLQLVMGSEPSTRKSTKRLRTKFDRDQEQEGDAPHSKLSRGNSPENKVQDALTYTIEPKAKTGSEKDSQELTIAEEPRLISYPDTEMMQARTRVDCLPGREVSESSKTEPGLEKDSEALSPVASLSAGEESLKTAPRMEEDSQAHTIAEEVCSIVYSATEMPLALPPVDSLPAGGGPISFLRKNVVPESLNANQQAEDYNLKSLGDVDQPLCRAYDSVRQFHDLTDISRGEEVYKIPIMNEITNEGQLPPYFNYTKNNLISQNARVRYSTAITGEQNACADCFGNCLAAPVHCACARVTGGQFAYTEDGLLKKEFLEKCIHMKFKAENQIRSHCKGSPCPLEKFKNKIAPETCKGHLSKQIIKECWKSCRCTSCGNRVVQRGIKRNLQVFFTGNEKGWGIRSVENLPRGSFVCEFVGEILTDVELYDRTLSMGDASNSCPIQLDAFWGLAGTLEDNDPLFLDPTFYGNVARFINHRCLDANLIEIPVAVETQQYNYYRVALFTTRDVKAFEELTWDYGIDFNDLKPPMKVFHCYCGSKYCRGTSTFDITKIRSDDRRMVAVEPEPFVGATFPAYDEFIAHGSEVPLQEQNANQYTDVAMPEIKSQSLENTNVEHPSEANTSQDLRVCTLQHCEAFSDDIGTWEKTEIPSRDDEYMILSTEMLYASIDQKSEAASGANACSVIAVVIVDWLEKNPDIMPTQSQLDCLILAGSEEWRNLCVLESYSQLFPDKRFDVETIVKANIRPLCIDSDKSMLGYFFPEDASDENYPFKTWFDSFDKVWDNIVESASACSTDGSHLIYIVSWNDHFFVLKVEHDAYYILDSLGERLTLGCTKGYILKFDENTTIRSIRNQGKDPSVEEEDVVCRGKESCREYMKRFLSAIPVRELDKEIKKNKDPVPESTMDRILQIYLMYMKRKVI